MLNGLDDIGWHEVHGPYGTVADLPVHIRALASSDTVAREVAFGWLCNNLIHQGTRFQVTPLAVPFLLDVLADAATLGKDEIILLVLSLAVDGDVPPVPTGFDLDGEFAAEKDLRINPADVRAIWSAANSDDLDPRLEAVLNAVPLRDHYDTYLAVERGVGAFVRLTADPDPNVRRAAVWTLGWFPHVARDAVGPLRAAAAREDDEYMLANMLLVLGLLDCYLDDRHDVPMLEDYLTSDRPRIVRRMAAIALGTVLGPAISTDVLDLLVAGTEDDDNLNADTERLGWSWISPSLKGCCWRVIHAMGL